MLGVLGFKFDGDLEVGLGVDALVDLAERTLVELPDDFVVLADFLGNLGHAESRV
jgi:hypothetical protein